MKRALRTILVTAACAMASGVFADDLKEDALGGAEYWQSCETADEAIDLRTVFPVTKLKDEPALQGFAYSARGWRLDVATDDPNRTAEIVAEPGTLVDGVFTPGAGTATTVMSARSGEGTVDWHPRKVEKAVYRLTHTAQIGTEPDAAATCLGYLDFTQCADSRAKLEEVAVAVLDEVTHEIAIVQDPNLPWQPIEEGVAGAGIATDADLASETTTTAFSFKGRGTFHCEYLLGGGSLAVWVDGVAFETLTPSAVWQAHAIRFEGLGAHQVAFVYTSADDGAAALRGVRWEDSDDSWAQDEGGTACMDLREGVRMPRCAAEVLPFAYSCTNWIGVAGTTAESMSRVTIMQLTGADPVVTNWTEVVPNTFRVLVNTSGEGEKRWRPKKGVWKATFDIRNGNESVYSEDAWFDLRKASVPGLAVIIF